MGATGAEILTNTHIENYPYPTGARVNKWFTLCEKYGVDPVENWRDIIRGVLPLAERLDLRLCPEIHIPPA